MVSMFDQPAGFPSMAVEFLWILILFQPPDMGGSKPALYQPEPLWKYMLKCPTGEGSGQ